MSGRRPPPYKAFPRRRASDIRNDDLRYGYVQGGTYGRPYGSTDPGRGQQPTNRRREEQTQTPPPIPSRSRDSSRRPDYGPTRTFDQRPSSQAAPPPTPDSRGPDYRNQSINQRPPLREALPTRPHYDNRQAYQRVQQAPQQLPLTHQAPAARPRPPPARPLYSPPPPSPATQPDHGPQPDPTYRTYTRVAKAKSLNVRARL